MNNGFDKQNDIGKIGEQMVTDFFESHGEKVIDVSGDMRYQQIDVDFVIRNTKIEVKTDLKMLKTGNIFLEFSKDRKTGNYPSWFYKSKADVIIFIDTNQRVMRVYRYSELKQISDTYPMRQYKDYVDGCITYFKAVKYEDTKPALLFETNL